MPPTKRRQVPHRPKGRDAALVAERVDVVYQLMLNRLRSEQIHAYIKKHHGDWPYARRTVDRYIAKALVRLREASHTVLEAERGCAIDALRDLYAKSMAINDYKGCLAIQKELDVLLGLNAPTQVEVKVSDARKRLEDEIAEAIAEAERITKG